MVGWKGRAYTAIAHILPIKIAYKIRYYHWNHRWPELDDPKRFTEKLMWLTQYNGKYNRELIQAIYDKFLVREYIESKGLGNTLIPLYGNYQDANRIDFSTLPDEYILKSTQSSGQNLIITDGKNVDKEKICNIVDGWMSHRKKKDRFQGYYFTDKESIVCEKLLRNENGGIPSDLRICCCNGVAKWIYCDIDTTDENMQHRKVYYREYFDTEWNYLPIDNVNRVRKDINTPQTAKPDNLEELIRIAEKLAEDFIFVRVDLYNIRGTVFFGELTPIPGMAGGFSPDEWDYKFGDMIELPKASIW